MRPNASHGAIALAEISSSTSRREQTRSRHFMQSPIGRVGCWVKLSNERLPRLSASSPTQPRSRSSLVRLALDPSLLAILPTAYKAISSQPAWVLGSGSSRELTLRAEQRG